MVDFPWPREDYPIVFDDKDDTYGSLCKAGLCYMREIDAFGHGKAGKGPIRKGWRASAPRRSYMRDHHNLLLAP